MYFEGLNESSRFTWIFSLWWHIVFLQKLLFKIGGSKRLSSHYLYSRVMKGNIHILSEMKSGRRRRKAANTFFGSPLIPIGLVECVQTARYLSRNPHPPHKRFEKILLSFFTLLFSILKTVHANVEGTRQWGSSGNDNWRFFAAKLKWDSNKRNVHAQVRTSRDKRTTTRRVPKVMHSGLYPC